jgi:calcineurin-like phosphoesterase family protein
MNTIFFISDTHFGHKNMLNFKREDGSPARLFSSVDEMNDCMIDRWNSVVRTGDKVYHLGDVILQMENASILSYLRGTKILIKGNHDKMQATEYLKYFKDIRGPDLRGEWKMVLSHIPLHPDSIKKDWTNVHGHVHHRSLADPRYYNVSVENINYTPIELGELKERINACTN